MVHLIARAALSATLGELLLTYDSRSREWTGDFSKARVHIRVSDHVTDSTMTGKIVDLKAARVMRRIAARRDVVSRLPRE